MKYIYMYILKILSLELKSYAFLYLFYMINCKLQIIHKLLSKMTIFYNVQYFWKQHCQNVKCKLKEFDSYFQKL